MSDIVGAFCGSFLGALAVAILSGMATVPTVVTTWGIGLLGGVAFGAWVVLVIYANRAPAASSWVDV